MKKITYIMVALAGLTFIACNKEKDALPEEETTPAVEEFTYTIAVVADTKAYLNGDHMTWQSGDQIGWFTDKAGSSEINMSADPRNFEVSSTAAMAAGDMIYAYAPYTTAGTVDAAPLSIPTAQDGVITDAMPMVSLPIALTNDMAASTDTPVGQASFLSLGAIIEYNVYTSDDTFGAEKVESVQFTSTSNIAGDFTVNLTTVAEDAIPAPSGLDQKTVTSTLATATTVGDSKANGIKVYQVIAPGTWSGTITVTTDIATYSYAITDKEFTRGKVKPFNVDLASVNATRVRRTEYLLSSTSWVLKGVNENGVRRLSSTGNTITFNSNHSVVMDFSVNKGKTYDHTWKGTLIDPSSLYGWDTSSMTWAISSSLGNEYIDIDEGYMLVYVQGDQGLDYGNYRINTLDATHLTVSIETYGETWTLLFEAAESPASLEIPYWHTFSNGDFGICPSYWHDGSPGWTEGLYYAELTKPYTLSGASWNITDAGYFEWVGTSEETGNWRHGIQLGTGAMAVSSFVLSSSSFTGTITKVTLGYNSGIIDASSLSVSCTVGGNAFGTPVVHGEGEYEAVFEGSASGEIRISVSSSTNGAIYLYYLAIQ